jgi:trigger factor
VAHAVGVRVPPFAFFLILRPEHKKMKSELSDISTCKKILDIEVPQEIVDSEITEIAKTYARKARVPGFRPGKAPLPVVKSRFREEIASEMLKHLLPKYFSEAAAERKLDLVDTPNFDSVDYASGQPLKFKAVFEVYPQLNISNYTGIPAKTAATAVDDLEVDATLAKLQQDNAELVPVEEDRAIQEGDFVEINFTGIVQGEGAPENVEALSAEKAVVEVGGPKTLKEFTENLLGAKVNEEKTFTITFLPDYAVKHLAGKTVEYKATPENIKEKRVPELNDEFAQGLGQFATLEELRSKIREDMEKHKRDHANEQLRDKLLEWLEANNEFEVPESLVERQIQVRTQRLFRDLERQGVNPQHLDVDWAKIRDDQQNQSIRDVKGLLILEYIADTENIQVTDEEVEQETERIALETKRPKEKVKELLSSRLNSQLRNKKTLDFLQEKAQIQPAAEPAQS